MPSLGGIKAGNAFIVLGVIDNTAKTLARIGRHFRRWGAQFQSMGQNLFLQTGLALTPAALGLSTYIKYDDVLKRIQGRNDGTAKSMAALSDEARATATELGYSAREIAQIMDEFAQRGFTNEDIMSMTKPTAKLARAAGPGTELDTRQSADVISTTLRAFKLASSDADHVANVFALAANKGNFALNDFVEAMSKVAPMAAEMGLSLEQTVAVLAQLRDVGIEAETAGYSLRNILLEAIDTKKVDAFNQSLKTLTGQTVVFADQAGNLRNVVEIISEIGVKTAKLGTATRTNLLNDLFGKRAVLSALVISRTTGNVADLTKQLKEVGDEAGRVAAIMNSGLGGVFRRLLSSIENLAIAMGESLALALTGLEKYINPIIRDISKWMTVNKNWTVGIGVAVTYLFALSTALIVTGISFKLLGIAIGTAATILTVFGAIPALVTIGIRSLGMSITILQGIFNIFLEVCSFVIGVFTAIYASAQFLIGGVGALIGFVQGLVWTFNLLIWTLGIAPTMIVVAGAIIIVVTSIIILTDWLKALSKLINETTEALLSLLNTIKTNGTIYFGMLSGAAQSAFETIKEGFATAANAAAAGDWSNAYIIGLSTIEIAWLKMRNVGLQVWRDIRIEADGFFRSLTRYMAALEAFFTGLGLGLGGVFKDIINPIAPGDENDPIARRAKAQMKLNAAAENKKDMDVLAKKEMEHQGKIHQGIIDAWLKDAGEKAAGVNAAKAPEMPQQAVSMPDLHESLKPLQGLEYASLEAAKAGYEHSLSQLGGSAMADKQVKELQKIVDNTQKIAENLQVA
jgi:TP901 family phage tail tape measure protein